MLQVNALPRRYSIITIAHSSRNCYIRTCTLRHLVGCLVFTDIMAASPLFSGAGYAFDNERLVVEVANSVYAIRNQVTPRGVRQLWQGLCEYINATLRSHKESDSGLFNCSYWFLFRT